MYSPTSFNNRTIVEPGVYSRILGQTLTVQPSLLSNKILFIDTGTLSPAYGFGAGVNGELGSGPNALYEFDNLLDFQTAIGGGVIWDAAKYLFSPVPSSPTINGVGSIFYIRAATTTASSTTFTFTGGSTNGGVLTFKSLTEGTIGNGALGGFLNRLSLGFGAQMFAGVLDTSKFKIKFYRGTYRGLDTTVSPNALINGVAQNACAPELIVETPEFSNIAEVIAWANINVAFKSWFKLTTGTVAGTGEVTSADLSANSSLKLFAGGTQSTDGVDLDDVLSVVTDLEYTFVMSDFYHSTVTGTEMTKIFAHLTTEARFLKFLVAPSGRDNDSFNNPLEVSNIGASVQVAEYYNSPQVMVIHGDVVEPTYQGTTLRIYSVFYHAAAVVGRMAGVSSQVPVTWLNILSNKGVKQPLTKKQREQCIKSGIMHLYKNESLGYFVINKDINCLQNNGFEFLPDGTSPHGSIMRISSLLNREIEIGIERRFIAGQNVNTSSPEDLKAYVNAYLMQRTATKTEDNLILSFSNVVVSLTGSHFSVTYAFTANGPISNIFVTGFMRPISISV